jgi:NAD(P)-dependent dehydrogenase (short-subunit alcohol dehydrogenase family)
MMLENKVAVIYGAGGVIGSAVARAFAADGANVFLTGRHLALSNLSPRTSLQPAAPPMRRRWTLSMNMPWTRICSL